MAKKKNFACLCGNNNFEEISIITQAVFGGRSSTAEVGYKCAACSIMFSDPNKFSKFSEKFRKQLKLPEK